MPLFSVSDGLTHPLGLADLELLHPQIPLPKDSTIPHTNISFMDSVFHLMILN